MVTTSVHFPSLGAPTWCPVNPAVTRVEVVPVEAATHTLDVDGKPVHVRVMEQVQPLPAQEDDSAWLSPRVQEALVESLVVVGVAVVAACSLRVVALTFGGR